MSTCAATDQLTGHCIQPRRIINYPFFHFRQFYFMNRICRLLLIVIVLAISPTIKSQAQIFDAIQAALIAAIKAADIVVQKAQNATIDLQNAQKAVENELSQLNLGEIGNWEQKTKDLYGEYFDELKKVKNKTAQNRLKGSKDQKKRKAMMQLYGIVN